MSAPDSTHAYNFPPFPEPPTGIVITPFKAFVECGTQITRGEDGIERDGLGIPTILLATTRSDGLKRKSKKKKNKGIGVRKGPWWTEYEKENEVQGTRIDYRAISTTLDRVHQAIEDFGKTYGVIMDEITQSHTIWRHFKMFIGVENRTLTGPKTVDDHEDDIYFDDEETNDFLMTTESNLDPTGLSGESPVPFPIPHFEGVAHDLMSGDSTTAKIEDVQDPKLQALIDDPRRSIQTFLSSEMHNLGHLWSPIACKAAPHILRIFVFFLIRNQVTGPERVENLRAALPVIDRAGKELALLKVVAHALPDAFGEACQMHWGTKQETLKFGVDQDQDWDMQEDKIRTEEAQDSTGDPSGWGADAGGWGGSGGWGGGTDSGWADSAPSWGSIVEPKPVVDPRPTLLGLFGPLALSNTHSPGLVEYSMRRIVSFSAPRYDSTPGGDPVESFLKSKLHQLVLAPWPDWDSDEERGSPQMLPTSSGDAQGHDMSRDHITVLVHIEDGSENATVLEQAVGMGIRGRWVQLARVSPDAESTNGQGLLWYVDAMVMNIPSFWIIV
ncbi:unnamed protein product [Mycena citricolor]|uniref:Uncharacterized protein n=1 Tax=Mycena citricolor TaxID=2018698 RepID=A0AAD2HC58_9AGAR|nr:unnamed protein product [Mycena citricolor]